MKPTIGTMLGSLATCGILALSGAGHAGQIWTDANGDGAPDFSVLIGNVSQVVAVDVWFDSQSFQFTAYNIWLEWSGLSSIGNGIHHMTGCEIDPNDTDVPVHFTGSACDPPQHGVKRVGTVNFHIDTLPSCVYPIIDPNNPLNVFSLLSSPSGYMLFQTRSGSRWGGTCGPPVANESKSWGEVKSLYQ